MLPTVEHLERHNRLQQRQASQEGSSAGNRTPSIISGWDKITENISASSFNAPKRSSSNVSGSVGRAKKKYEPGKSPNLRDYDPREQETLELARQLFTSNTFSAGLFFLHGKSRYKNNFATYLIEAVGTANSTALSK